MISASVAVLRLIAGGVGGALFILLPLQFFSHDWSSGDLLWDPGVYHLGGSLLFGFPLVIVGIGALLGLLPGIAWAIDQKSARWRFLLWSIFGIVIGFVAATLTNRAAPMIAFCIAGVYVGIVSALKRLGVFKDKSESE